LQFNGSAGAGDEGNQENQNPHFHNQL